MKRYLLILSIILAVVTHSCQESRISDIPGLYLHYLLAGETTDNSVILQARMGKSDTLIDYDIKGAEGYIRFELSDNIEFEDSKVFPWQSTLPENDLIAKEYITGLEPGKTYLYRCHYGFDKTEYVVSEPGKFKTLQGREGSDPVRLVMVTGSNYHRFKSGGKGGAIGEIFPPATPEELKKGFPGHVTILEQEPDYWIGNGDNVYYDQPAEEAAETVDEMRAFWHRLYSMPRFKSLLLNTSTFWLKDDHDRRYDDSDTTDYSRKNGQHRPLPTNADGINTFLEQVPVPEKTYRTYRINQTLQIWMVEGRDYRSPNTDPDGPEKSIWGKEQLEWLKTTLLESDAPHKLLISPTPMIGPDDNWKIDNHCNLEGFRIERDRFFQWLADNQLIGSGFYVLCGDRHWQYHAVDPSGVEEFSCGALVDANSRYGRVAGDPESTDPEGLISQPYLQEKPSGGFLLFESGKKDSGPYLTFRYFDEKGTQLYEITK